VPLGGHCILNNAKVTAVIPAYNEAGRIGKTVQSVSDHVDDIIVIDDASGDDTGKEAEQAGAMVLRQPQNQGYIAAIKRGFQEARGDIVVTIDADGEFPAEIIPDLVQPILAGRAEMVQGKRNLTPRPSERFLTWLASLKGPVGDSGTGFRALRIGLARMLELRGACICGIFSLEVLAKGNRIVEVPVQLKTVDKPRRIAWYHLRQLFYLLPWLFKRL
jgi:glycosyltransferase involved in cell wall biosynthesis